MQREPRISITTIAILLTLICVGLLVTLYAQNVLTLNSPQANFSITVQQTACSLLAYLIALPDNTQAARQVLDETSLRYSTIEVSYLGSYPPGTTPNPNCSYTANTNFSLVAQIESLTDRAVLADVVVTAVDALITVENLPAPANMLTITFEAIDESYRFSTTFDAVAEARAENLTDEDLIKALGGLR